MHMRPFPGSWRCACVSTPEPVRSRYQKDVGVGMPKFEPPLGEMLMCPWGERGAVALWGCVRWEWRWGRGRDMWGWMLGWGMTVHPEHLLLEDPWLEGVGYGFVEDAHIGMVI